VAAFGDENVCGFDVAMNYSFPMGSLEPCRDPYGNVEEGFSFHRTETDAVLQRCALQVLHSDERTTVSFFDVVDGADVGMV
jgi:ABC-type microcin C transport system duplicated ATPase subunit YejF